LRTKKKKRSSKTIGEKRSPASIRWGESRGRLLTPGGKTEKKGISACKEEKRKEQAPALKKKRTRFPPSASRPRHLTQKGGKATRSGEGSRTRIKKGKKKSSLKHPEGEDCQGKERDVSRRNYCYRRESKGPLTRQKDILPGKGGQITTKLFVLPQGEKRKVIRFPWRRVSLLSRGRNGLVTISKRGGEKGLQLRKRRERPFFRKKKDNIMIENLGLREGIMRSTLRKRNNYLFSEGVKTTKEKILRSSKSVSLRKKKMRFPISGEGWLS